MAVGVRRSVTTQGITTSWLEVEAAPDAADVPPVLLLHGGAWGECAETAWAPVLAEWADGRRVLAPDWLGFGHSDKLRDFADLQGRMVTVLASWLRHLGLDTVDAVGLSMGGANLLLDLTRDRALPLHRVALLSAGGDPIRPELRRELGGYDGTVESMRGQLALACANPAVAGDAATLAARHAASLLPGAFEVMASLGLRSPVAAPPPPGDTVPYERIGLPVLVVAGGADRLKPVGFADDAVRRIPNARLVTLPTAGHCVQLDAPRETARAVLTFFDDPEVSTMRQPSAPAVVPA